MKLANIGMEKAQAWNAYREYRTAIGKSGDQRDKAVMAGYKALAKGKTVIDLLQCMKEAGTFESGLPRLAIIRADKNTCYCLREKNGSLKFCNHNSCWIRGEARIYFKSGTFMTRSDDVKGKAIVPLIPPQFRPGPSMLKKYFILWEANWETVPKDPALLKHLSGNLYSVVATWDLTPVEQAVLRI